MKQLVAIALFFCASHMFGQQGYAKDSLQFKAYVHILYESARASSISVKKVFCDYCTETQLKYLKQKFWEMANSEKYNPEVRLNKGLRKRTLLTRISKKDFEKLKSD